MPRAETRAAGNIQRKPRLHIVRARVYNRAASATHVRAIGHPPLLPIGRAPGSTIVAAWWGLTAPRGGKAVDDRIIVLLTPVYEVGIRAIAGAGYRLHVVGRNGVGDDWRPSCVVKHSSRSAVYTSTVVPRVCLQPLGKLAPTQHIVADSCDVRRTSVSFMRQASTRRRQAVTGCALTMSPLTRRLVLYEQVVPIQYRMS